LLYYALILALLSRALFSGSIAHNAELFSLAIIPLALQNKFWHRPNEKNTN